MAESKDTYSDAIEGTEKLDDILAIVNGARPAQERWTRIELLLLLVTNRLRWVDVEDEDDDEPEVWQR